MHSTVISTLALLAGSAFATPITYPAGAPPSNDVNPADFAKIAGGGPPNSGLPPNVSSAAIADFTVVNFLENFESGFFAQAIEWIQGWNHNHELDILLDVVTTIHAQEEIHVATAENILKASNKPTLAPCKYTFNNINNVQDFINLANIITVTGIGAVINLAAGLAVTDPGLVQGPASILGNEARQDAFFRLADVTIGFNKKQYDLEVDVLAPQPAPFDTRISAPYALNLASPFISDCPAPPPPFPKIPSMTADLPRDQQKVTGSSGPIKFTVDSSFGKNATSASDKLFVGWVNQANKVNYVDAQLKGNTVYASIPDGLAGAAFAALTNQNTLPDVNSLTAKTLAGPAVVIIS